MRSPNIRTFFTICLAAAIGLSAAPTAFGSGLSVIKDCNANNGLTRTYSSSELKDALGMMPSDVDEYSDCRAIINAALANAVAKRKFKRPDPSKPLSKAQQARIDKSLAKVRDDLAKNDFDTDTAGAHVKLGNGHTLTSDVEPGIPGTLAFALAGIALFGAAEFFGRGRRFVRDRRAGDRLAS